MKQTSTNSRLHWPRDGIAIRVPARRVAAQGATCELIPFSGTTTRAGRQHPWDDLASGLPRGAAVVLLVAAEDVSFTAADIPALSGLRLREALPNLVEERTVGEVGSLHVALGQAADEGRGRTLAVIDRMWLATMQVHVVRSGHRVAAIVPESLAVPLAADSWSLACVGASTGDMRCWLRTATQQAMLLPDDAASAASIASALARQGGALGGTAAATSRPSLLALYASATVAPAATLFADALATSLGIALNGPRASNASMPPSMIAAMPAMNARPDSSLDASAAAGGRPSPSAGVDARDPFVAWLAGGGPDGAYGPALSLLSSDGTRGGPSTWSRWRLAASLALAMVAVQIVGMQWQWSRLRGEASMLRQQSNALLTTTFPNTTVVSDAPLQMSNGLARLRASSGRSDPADFTTMMAASARIFAALPSNALRGTDYEARALRLRFAPGAAVAADERDRLVAAALQEGYALRFDAAPNAAGEAAASLKPQGGA